MAADNKLASPTQQQQQHRVLRQVTERLGRLLTAEIRAVSGLDVPVHFAYQGEPNPKKAHLTLVHYWIDRVTDRGQDRQQERSADGSEFFRAPPLLLISRYLLTAWAAPLADQELLGLAMRVLFDHPVLEPDGAGDEDAVHWDDRPGIELSAKFTLDEGQRVAAGLGMPLRASARYDVHFRLDSERKTPIKRVKDRIVDYKKLDG